MMDKEDMSKEELLKYIETLEKRVGLTWNKNSYIKDGSNPILEEVFVKRLESTYSGCNTLYEGDNILTLKELIRTATLFDFIYIDPPYNKHKDIYSYTDNFKIDANSDKHSKWLSFMEERLLFSRKLMKDTGIVVISIDESEYAHLKLLCDSIFKKSNFIASLIWVKSKVIKTNSKFFSNNHEYILVYAKKKSECAFRGDLRTEETISNWYQNKDNDARGLWTRGSITSITYSEKNDYELRFKNGKVYRLKDGKSWKYPLSKMLELENDNRISFEPNMPRLKKFLNEMGEYTTPISILEKPEFYSQIAYDEIIKVFGKSVFKFAKPVDLVAYLIDKIDNNNASILDLFGGSGTTIEATMKLNIRDSSNRCFTVCNNNENKICEEITYNRAVYTYNNYRPFNLRYIKVTPEN